MKKRNKILSVASVAIATFGLTGLAATAEEVILKGASCFTIGSPPSVSFEKLVKEINEKGKGVVKINLVGGAPAIGSALTLTQKMSIGIFDILGCPETYFGNVVPEVPVLRLTKKPFAELRKNGAMAYLETLFNKKNIHYVGRHYDFGGFSLWLNKKIDKPDLTGLNLRTAENYTAFFKALGANVQSAEAPQILPLMENNILQGFGWPAGAFAPPWMKVTRYQVKPSFYQAPMHTIFNLEKWESMTDAQRNLVTKITMAHELSNEPGNPTLGAHLAKGDKIRADAGIEVIEFTGEQAKLWSDTAEKAAWDEVLSNNPENGHKLMELFK
ncbi:MAG: TRAP transporter substrate-binding protein DctP [Alphaproteobacteria bacterium]|nr:TRAP transporter substrate-binding protein DctP [Alphaproteobacteria bacterium]